MRATKNHIRTRERAGSIELEPEDTEDLWHLDNLLRPTDLLSTHTKRKVKSESATSSKTETLHGILTIRVERHVYDGSTGQLFVSGRVAEENPIAAVGSHHTLHVELNKKFKIAKDPRGNAAGGAGDGIGWDTYALDLLRAALDVQRRAEIYAIVMDEGMGNICLITESQTKHLQCVKEAVPKKRSAGASGGGEAHDRGVERFYKTLLATLLRHLDVTSTNQDGRQAPLLLASPGFVAQGFQKHMAAYASTKGDKALAKYVREHVLVAHSSGGNLQNLAEVLKNPHVLPRLSDTKFAQQTQRMDKFLDLLRQDDGRAWYGHKEVIRAVEKGAVTNGGTLFMSNSLFRSYDIPTRKKWAALVDQVKHDWGGEVLILSNSHESGKRLEGLSGIAAILAYPLLDLDEDEEDDSAGHAPTNGERRDRELEDADLGL